MSSNVKFIHPQIISSCEDFSKKYFNNPFTSADKQTFRVFYHLLDEFDFTQTIPSPRVYFRNFSEYAAQFLKIKNDNYFPKEIQDFIFQSHEHAKIIFFQIHPNTKNKLHSILHLYFYVFDPTISLIYFIDQVKLILAGLYLLTHSLNLHLPLSDKREKKENITGGKRDSHSSSSSSSSHSACNILELHIVWTPFDKKLPDTNGQSIKAIHVNSGLTTTSTIKEENENENENELHLSLIDKREKIKNMSSTRVCGNQVIVYRFEEWFKVMLHECIHFYSLDFHLDVQDKVEFQEALQSFYRFVKTPHDSTSSILLFEAYTEFWAEIIQIAVVSFLNAPVSVQIYMNHCHDYLQIEIIHSLAQCNRICNYYDNDITLMKIIQGDEDALKKWKESTNVYAYFIIKFIFLFYHSDFFHWCKIHNSSQLQFTSWNFPSFLLFLQRCFLNPNLSRWILYLQSQPEFISLLLSFDNENKLFFSIFDFVYQA